LDGDEHFFLKRLMLLYVLISSISEPFCEEYSDENIKNAEAQRLNGILKKTCCRYETSC
jgi:hypothetical protein